MATKNMETQAGEKRGHGRRYGGWAVSLLVQFSTMGLIGFGGITQDARAATYSYSGYNGYLGNDVVYMTTGGAGPTTPGWVGSGSPYVLSTTWKQAAQTESQSYFGLANALNLSIGQASNTTANDMMFAEAYWYNSNNPSASYLQVNMPFLDAGGSEQSYALIDCGVFCVSSSPHSSASRTRWTLRATSACVTSLFANMCISYFDVVSYQK